MKYFVTVNGNKYEVEVEADEVALTQDTISSSKETTNTPVKKEINVSGADELVKAPMPGKILDIKVTENQTIKKGDLLFILEAMKMENEIVAARDGIVTGIYVNKGDSVNTGDSLLAIK